MQFLLIEDDPNKSKQIELFLSTNYPLIGLKIMRSYQSGLKALLDKSCFYEVVMLDMSLPTFDRSPTEDGYLHKQMGGEEVLREIKRKGLIHKVIVVTGFDVFGHGDQLVSIENLKLRLKSSFPDNYIDTVYYGTGESKWKEHLKTTIEFILHHD